MNIGAAIVKVLYWKFLKGWKIKVQYESEILFSDTYLKKQNDTNKTQTSGVAQW